MTTYVALLYSIILGQGRRVVMADLRAMAAELGLLAPRTLVATGNLVFEAKDAAVAQLETRLETAFEKTFRRHVDIIVRSASDWQRLAAGNPFPEESRTDADQVIARVMRRPLDRAAVATLEPYRIADERIEIVDGDLWVYFRRTAGTSKLLAVLTRKQLGGAGTSRNWNTVRRLADMVGS